MTADVFKFPKPYSGPELLRDEYRDDLSPIEKDLRKQTIGGLHDVLADVRDMKTKAQAFIDETSFRRRFCASEKVSDLAEDLESAGIHMRKALSVFEGEIQKEIQRRV